MKRHAVPRISEAEWLIMRVLWAASPATAKHIVSAVEGESAWSPKTVLTLVNRLVAKGALGFRTEARTRFYFARVAERDCVRAESRSFLKRVYGGAVGPMLAHFVEDAALSEADIQDLRRVLDERSKGKKPSAEEKP
jgi:BlaI family penicillinase repressor